MVIGLLVAPAGAAVVSLLEGGVETSNVPLRASNGPTVTVEGTTQSILSDFTEGTDTVVYETADGTITVSGASGTAMHVHRSELSTNTVRFDNLDVSAGAMTIDHDAHAELTLEGGANWFEYRTVGVSDGNVDFEYSSTGTTTATLRGLPENQQLGFVDSSSNSFIASAESSSNGVATVTLPDGQYSVELTSSRNEPTLSNPSPTGDLGGRPTELSVDLNDSDYPNDEHTVSFYLDGSLVETKTITQEQTVTADINSIALTSGEHNWRVFAEDGYGNTIDRRYSFQTPGDIVIRNESNPDQLVDDTTVEVSFYADDTVIRKTTSNGTISLASGLPVGQQLYVTAESDGYHSRTTALGSLYEQRSVYLLPNATTDTVEVRFTLDDSTGIYPPDSTLYVERALEQDNTTSYKTIVSDEFGVEGVTTRLVKGDRYQIRIENPDGDVAVLGSYTADISETVPLSPKTSDIDLSDDGQGMAFDAHREGENSLKIEYQDTADATERLSVTVYERGNESNVLRPTQTYYDMGNLSLSEELDAEARNTTWVAEFEGERNGEEFSGRVIVGDGPLNLIPSELDGVWQVSVGVFVLLTSSLIFSSLNVGVGAIATSITGGVLWWIGLLSGVATGAGIVLAIGVAIAYHAVFRSSF